MTEKQPSTEELPKDDTRAEPEKGAVLVPLLQEYTEKLRVFSREYGPARVTEARGKIRRDFWMRFRPPAESLAKRVSQLIEHGKLEEDIRVELRLRLAEFENALFEADFAASGRLS